MSTIAAISSPPGPGERGVIRISGPRARAIVAASFRAGERFDFARRGLASGRFDDGRGEQPALLLWMPAPRSFTREDVAELHLPGSPPLLACALERVLSLGAVLAAPGEFTRRAFENGRIDLTRAEGVLALVHATAESERRSAAALLFGGLERRVEELRASLEDLRALCEAALDFDERDTGAVERDELDSRAQTALAAADAAIAWEERREPVSGLPRVALVGAANAGKSSVFNQLTGGRALVSEQAGTTREPLRAVWNPAGAACVLSDTAGLASSSAAGRESPDHSAQELAAAERGSADLFLWVIDSRRARSSELEAERASLFATSSASPRLVVWNKTDLADSAAVPPKSLDEDWSAFSARTGAGRAELERRTASLLGRTSTAAGGPARELALRHRRALALARDRLAEATDLLGSEATLDLVAASLRAATDALDDIAGRTTPEDLLDRIFARFCLGK